jgi:predicted MPP superfamily phosphohydrolase
LRLLCGYSSQAGNPWQLSGTHEAVPALIRALEDEHKGVREAAADALGPIRALQYVIKFTREKEDIDLLDVIAETQERLRSYNPALLPLDRQFCIVHLSDLHFGTVDRAGDLYVQLLLDVNNEPDIRAVDVLVISGDVVNKCSEQGYTYAKDFLGRIAEQFTLTPEKIVVAPGNHDVDRKKSERAYTVKRRKDVQGPIDEDHYIDKEGDYVEEKDEATYRKRFAPFQSFYADAGLGDYSAEYSRQVTWREYPDQKVLIVGLNSAWKLDHHYTWRSHLEAEALNQVIEKAMKPDYQPDWLKIAVWHHPIRLRHEKDTDWNESWIRDDGIMDRLASAGFSMILHGHAHKGAAWNHAVVTGNRRRTIHVVAAGTLDAEESELTPGSYWQYNVIRVNDRTVSVQCRKRIDPRGISRPDTTWREGKSEPVYEFELPAECL